MKYIDLSNVQESGEGERLLPGGYICKIKSCKDFPEKEYLKIEYDIAEGKYKAYYSNLFASKNFWGGNFIRSYKDAALPFFKSFVTSIENSNGNFKYDGQNEQSFIGKFIGLVLAEEEYLNNDNNIKTRLYVAETRSIENIRNGKFNKYELKKLNAGSSNKSNFGNVESVNDDELPF